MTSTTPTRTLRAKSPADLLACVPALLGFHPERSLVMATAGPAGVPVHARVDLPADTAAVADIWATARELAGVASRSLVRDVVLVVYTDDLGLASAVGAAMTEELSRAQVHVLLALTADGRRWFAHGPDGSLAPGPGQPYTVETHPLTVEAVVGGRVVHPSRQALAASLAPRPDETARVRLAAGQHRDWRSGTSGASGHRKHLVMEGRWVGRRVRRFLEDRMALDACDAGRLLIGMLALDVRDVAWAEMDHDNCVLHVDLWRDLLRRSPPELGAAPASLLAFAAWLSGDGALAWCALDRCEECDAGYSMAGLVTQALASAVPPSTWTPLTADVLPLFRT